jgi:hypothetical protein
MRLPSACESLQVVIEKPRQKRDQAPKEKRRPADIILIREDGFWKHPFPFPPFPEKEIDGGKFGGKRKGENKNIL